MYRGFSIWATDVSFLEVMRVTARMYTCAQLRDRRDGLQAMADEVIMPADGVAQTLASIHTESGASLLALAEAIESRKRC